jgi:hypothetical protein
VDKKGYNLLDLDRGIVHVIYIRFHQEKMPFKDDKKLAQKVLKNLKDLPHELIFGQDVLLPVQPPDHEAEQLVQPPELPDLPAEDSFSEAESVPERTSRR